MEEKDAVLSLAALAQAMHDDSRMRTTETTSAPEAAPAESSTRLLRLITLVQDEDTSASADDTKAQVLDELEAIIEVQQETLARLECLYQTIREL